MTLDRWHEQWRATHGGPMVLGTDMETDDLHRWEGGVWHNITPKFNRLIRLETGLSLTKYAISEALDEATNTAPYLDGDRHGLDSEAPWINFRNGVYDLDSGELREHGRPWHTTRQVPHDYLDLEVTDIELATMPLDLYFRERVAEDTADAGVLWQLLGSAMLHGNPSQTFAVLQGPAGSGKGTYLSLLNDVIGTENVTSLSLEQLGNRFAAAGVRGMLANIAGDVNGGVVPAYDLILRLTGGDLITADRKHRTPIAFVWNGLLILATNGRLIPPAGAGSEAGWWRRALYIDMPNAVAERIDAGQLRGQIAPDLDVIATRAAHAVRTAWQNGAVPTITPSMARATAAARTSGDPVTDWCEDRLNPRPGGEVQGKDAHRDYVEWCDYFGYEPRGGRRFYEDLERTLSRKGWGERIEGRNEASRVTFTGVTLDARKVWSLAF